MTDRDRRLQGIQRKLSRGSEQLEALETLVNAHVETHPIHLIAEPQGEAPTTEYHVRVEDFEPVDYIDVGVKIGEALHLYRSILDNLVWHLSIQNTGQDPPPDARRIAFPIINNKWHWNKRGKPQIESVAEDPAAVIYRAQPFRARHAPDPEPLSLLAGLNNIDKHRVIIPMAVMSKTFEKVGELNVSEPDTTVQLDATGQTVEKDATVYIFRFSKPTYVQMEYHGAFAIALDVTRFQNTSLVSSYPFDRVVSAIATEVTVIAMALKPWL